MRSHVKNELRYPAGRRRQQIRRQYWPASYFEATLIRPQSAATQLYNQWQGLALSSAQYVLAAYGETSTWTLGYKLFADVWLGTNLVGSSVGLHVC